MKSNMNKKKIVNIIILILGLVMLGEILFLKQFMILSTDFNALNSGNTKSEEMRTISFLLRDGIVSKIVIKRLD